MQLATAAAVTASDRTFELKFLLPDHVADQVLAWARRHLACDPHADGATGDVYRVNSLYFDTAGFDVYHRLGSHGRRKYRLRRYNSEPRVYLERKSKLNGQVKKRRTVVPDCEIGMLRDLDAGPTWSGHWFRRRLAAWRLRPQLLVAYERVARVGVTPEGPIRLTVDRQVWSRVAAGLGVPRIVEGTSLVAGQSIVELKYPVAMPALFKGMIHDMGLCPTAVSKYRLGVTACGLNGVALASAGAVVAV